MTGENKKVAISGLYAVTPDITDTNSLIRKVGRVLEGGARVVQYRNKTADENQRLAQARALVALCDEFGVPLIVNDSVEVARAGGAGGVHLGAEDAGIADARARLGGDKIIGVSCYTSIERALDAERAGADYVAFGSFFASSVKPVAPRASLTVLHEAKSKLRIPIVAIGGVTPDNAPQLIAAGADAVAVISGLFDADVRLAARRFTALFESRVPSSHT